MDVLIAALLGLIIGWLGSLALSAPSQGTILLYAVSGLVGSILGPLLFGSDYLFDVLLAAALSAMIAVFIAYLSRRAWSRWRPTRV